MNLATRLAAALSLATLLLPAARATCYTVVDGEERVVYQSMEAPFDVSGSLTRQVARHYSPKHHLLITANAYCPGSGQSSGVYGAPLQGSRIDGNVSPALRLADSGATWTAPASRSTDAINWVPAPVPAPSRSRR